MFWFTAYIVKPFAVEAEINIASVVLTVLYSAKSSSQLKEHSSSKISLSSSHLFWHPFFNQHPLYILVHNSVTIHYLRGYLCLSKAIWTLVQAHTKCKHIWMSKAGTHKAKYWAKSCKASRLWVNLTTKTISHSHLVHMTLWCGTNLFHLFILCFT